MPTLIAALFLTLILAAQPAQAPPSPGVIAVVLDEPIVEAQRDILNSVVFSTLIDRFVEQNALAPTEAEVESLAGYLRRTMERERQEWQSRRDELRAEIGDQDNLVDQSLVEKREELARLDELLTMMSMSEIGKPQGKQARESELMAARPFVRWWKINKALYDKYGGRVAFQQAGLEPIDAWRAFLKEQEAAGAFRFADDATRDAFWAYWNDDSRHHFLPEDPDAKHFDVPWWLAEEPE